MKNCCIFLCVFCSTALFGQFSVKGKVVDSATMEPLYGASVFCQNTTSGTTTDKLGDFTLPLKSGGYELIVSFTGYTTQQTRITSNDSGTLKILLVKEDKSMQEVIIRSSNEVTDGWEKYGKFFLENFVGTTPNAAQCTLQNPDVLHFYYFKKSDKLKVTATEPVVVVNKALGYNLRYQLDSFMYYYKTLVSSYRGFCFFSEMEGSFSDQKIWSENRKKAYYGSKLHFMRAYYDSSLHDDEYEIAMLDSTNDKRFEVVKNPYDTSYYEVDDSLKEVQVYYPRKISVTYKKKPEAQYLQKFKLPPNVSTEISYVDLLDGVAIKDNGFFYDQKDWVTQGYWSWKNLADLLPYDYIP